MTLVFSLFVVQIGAGLMKIRHMLTLHLLGGNLWLSDRLLPVAINPTDQRRVIRHGVPRLVA